MSEPGIKMVVDLKEHSYPIYIERGIMGQAAERIKEVYHGRKVIEMKKVMKGLIQIAAFICFFWASGTPTSPR